MAYYLEDLNRVKNLSFEQLESWKANYPYSQLVHFLMAKKYQLAGLTDNMNIFHRASYFAVDRDHFYERMTNSESESSALAPEEIIEAEEILETISPDEFPKTNEITPEIETSLAENVEIEIENEAFTEEMPEETMETAEPLLSIEKEQQEYKPIPDNDQFSPFTQWLMSLQPDAQKIERPKIEIEEEIIEEEEEEKEPLTLEEEVEDQNLEEKKVKKSKKKKKKKKKEKKRNKLEAQIENSVIMKREIVSEPLAKILAQQGHNEKAVEMYRKLSLIFPEKSSFFASQIDKINNSN